MQVWLSYRMSVVIVHIHCMWLKKKISQIVKRGICKTLMRHPSPLPGCDLDLWHYNPLTFDLIYNPLDLQLYGLKIDWSHPLVKSYVSTDFEDHRFMYSAVIDQKWFFRFNATMTLIFDLMTSNSIGVIHWSQNIISTKFEDYRSNCSPVIDYKQCVVYWWARMASAKPYMPFP